MRASNAADSPATDSMVGAVLAGGKLRLDAKLGAGAMGEVYRATHRDLQMTVAVKVLLPRAREGREFSEQFQAEARAASLLDHKNLTRVIDFGEEPSGLLYLSMEYLHGRTLEYDLRSGPLSQARAVAVMMQICAGLWHAHARNVIHRDVKPANIVLVPDHDDEGLPFDLVKVCDFGMATAPANTGNGEDICGTPEYMAPEVLTGGQADGRADLYACGVLLFELTTGRLPFLGQSVAEIAGAHVSATPPRPSSLAADLDPALEQIILRALAKSPTDRFPSVRALRNALKELAVAPTSRSAPALTSGVRHAVPAVPAVSAATANANAGRASWIEDAAASYDSALRAASGRYHDGEDFAAELVSAPRERLDAIASLRNGPAFADAVDQLQTISSRETLRTLAERALSDPMEPSKHVAQLLAWAEGAGAAALYAARLDTSRRVNRPGSRDRFVGLMATMGPAAIPVLRDALERLAPHGESISLDAPLLCDLLLAIPPIPDQALADVVRRYTRAEMPAVTAAALRALGALGEVDHALVRRLAALVTGNERAPLEVRLAAADALAASSPAARGTATRVSLSGVLLGSGVLSRILRDAPIDELVVACARTALALSRRDAVEIIKSRAQKSGVPLRARLLALI